MHAVCTRRLRTPRAHVVVTRRFCTPLSRAVFASRFCEPFLRAAFASRFREPLSRAASARRFCAPLSHSAIARRFHAPRDTRGARSHYLSVWPAHCRHTVTKNPVAVTRERERFILRSPLRGRARSLLCRHDRAAADACCAVSCEASSGAKSAAISAAQSQPSSNLRAIEKGRTSS